MSNRKGNLLVEDWSDADFIFLSSLCFSDGLLSGISEKSKSLKPGSIILTSKLPANYEENFVLDSKLWLKSSWGSSRIFKLVRKAV